MNLDVIKLEKLDAKNSDHNWGKKVSATLVLHGVTKRKFAEMIDVNYNILINTLSGYLIRQDIKNKIYTGLENLKVHTM